MWDCSIFLSVKLYHNIVYLIIHFTSESCFPNSEKTVPLGTCYLPQGMKRWQGKLPSQRASPSYRRESGIHVPGTVPTDEYPVTYWHLMHLSDGWMPWSWKTQTLQISMHILHSVFHIFPKVLTGRFWFIIKSFFSQWSFPLFLRLYCVTRGDIVRRN